MMRHLSIVGDQTERGATLVELFITLALLGLILGAVCASFISQRRAMAVQSQRGALIQQAQAAMDLLTREIRRAGTNPTGCAFQSPCSPTCPNGCPPLWPVTYSATQLDVRADLNGNGTTDTTADPDEHLIYAYDSTNERITRNAGNGAQPLVENIQAFTFQYLDCNCQATTDSSAIHQLQICITARTATADPRYTTNNGYRTFTMTSLIDLRDTTSCTNPTGCPSPC